MSHITRRDLATLFTAAGAFGTLPAPAVRAASNLTKLKVGTLPIIDFVPLYAAKLKGFFEAERLDVTITPTAGGATAYSSLLSGNLQACISSSVPELIVAQKGLVFPLVGCAAFVGKGPPHDMSTLIVRKKDNITTGKSLNGKRAGINLLDNISWLTTRMWMDDHGGDSATLSFIEIPFPQQGDALLNGRVDVIQLNEPFVSLLVNSHRNDVEILCWVYSATLPNSLISGVFATQEYITKNTAQMEAFSLAYNHGVDWVNKNLKKPALYKLISSYSKIPEARVQAIIGWPEYKTKVSPTGFLNFASSMKKYKLLTKVPPVEDLVFSAVRL